MYKTVFCLLVIKPDNNKFGELSSDTVVILLQWIKLEFLTRLLCSLDPATMHCPIMPPDPALPKNISLAWSRQSEWDCHPPPPPPPPIPRCQHSSYSHTSSAFWERGTHSKGRGVKETSEALFAIIRAITHVFLQEFSVCLSAFVLPHKTSGWITTKLGGGMSYWVRKEMSVQIREADLFLPLSLTLEIWCFDVFTAFPVCRWTNVPYLGDWQVWE